ncbi:hypothetical protein AOQ84DRAFT_440637 [Glonium stellatum]|uniref:DUF2423 domain-containing protein n=1 Tax=Glonium stellatum TaxID=574774 RepID=A0A8E2JRA5_9PEZI|nr:hypothetical protein AOQ84DRAFT_440637 [Glonium stellatum]
MAKGLRSSVKKAHRTKLRSRVFAPVEDARTERLSAKLLELASQPRPVKTDMDLDEENGITAPLPRQTTPPRSPPSNNSAASKSDAQPDVHQDQQAEDMDIDDGADPAAAAAKTATTTTTTAASSKLKKKSPRVQKKRRGKPASTIKFPARRRDGVKASAGRKGKR